ncbi:MAG: DMT family transporter [Clostridia bacterium]|nr:DMT family transporter [Clostridia bacterium]
MKKTYFYAGVSILLWSSLATVSKLLLGTMNSYKVLCISAFFAAVALLIVNLFTKRLSVLKAYKLKDYLTIILIGLPGTFFYYVFLYLGTDRMLASQAFIINYLWPIMSVVFACILLKEKLTIRKIIAIAMSFLGVITVAGGELASFNLQTLFGMLFCIGAAVSYGLFTALNQKWHYDKFVSLMLSFVAAFGLSLIINLAMGTNMGIGAFEALGLGWNGLTVMAIATVTWALALDSGKTAKVSNLAYITPFLSLVWTAIFLKEPINPWSVLGLVVIVLGIFVQLKEGKKQIS